MRLPKSMQLIVMRFSNDQFLIGVTGVIFNNNNEVMLFKHTYRTVAWSLPGGYLKAGEHPRRGLRREIQEESGLQVTIIQNIGTQEDSSTARIDMAYWGIVKGGTFRASEEVSACQFCTIESLPELIDGQKELIISALERKKHHDSRKRWQKIKSAVSQLFNAS